MGIHHFLWASKVTFGYFWSRSSQPAQRASPEACSKAMNVLNVLSIQPKRMTRSNFLNLFFLLLLFCVVLSFTNEPPGRDPVSVDKVRKAERAASLTSDNFDELTKGKLVYIKFFSP